MSTGESFQSDIDGYSCSMWPFRNPGLILLRVGSVVGGVPSWTPPKTYPKDAELPWKKRKHVAPQGLHYRKRRPNYAPVDYIGHVFRDSPGRGCEATPVYLEAKVIKVKTPDWDKARIRPLEQSYIPEHQVTLLTLAERTAALAFLFVRVWRPFPGSEVDVLIPMSLILKTLEAKQEASSRPVKSVNIKEIMAVGEVCLLREHGGISNLPAILWELRSSRMSATPERSE